MAEHTQLADNEMYETYFRQEADLRKIAARIWDVAQALGRSTGYAGVEAMVEIDKSVPLHFRISQQAMKLEALRSRAAELESELATTQGASPAVLHHGRLAGGAQGPQATSSNNKTPQDLNPDENAGSRSLVPDESTKVPSVSTALDVPTSPESVAKKATVHPNDACLYRPVIRP